MKTRDEIWIEAPVQGSFLPFHTEYESLYSTYEDQIQQRKLCKTDITVRNFRVELRKKQEKFSLKFKKLFV